MNFDINESNANILTLRVKHNYYDEGVYSLRQVCMHRLVDKGGIQPPKALGAGAPLCQSPPPPLATPLVSKDDRGSCLGCLNYALDEARQCPSGGTVRMRNIRTGVHEGE